MCLIQSQNEMEMDPKKVQANSKTYYKSISHLLHSHGLTYPRLLLASLGDAAVFVLGSSVPAVIRQFGCQMRFAYPILSIRTDSCRQLEGLHRSCAHVHVSSTLELYRGTRTRYKRA